jgi:FKBP-type peptidyl-prolyl cis-trans isomerase 2
MIKRSVLPALVGMVMLLTSCFPEVESDVEKSIERDDSLLANYISRNNIDAIKTALGYYYQKETTNDIGEQIENGEVIGVYYEIKTIDEQLIESYLDESKRPRIFVHSEGGLVPRAINFASGISKKGETLMLYVPSYLGYQDYNYQQLIQPNSNLVIKVKYVETYSEEELRLLEEELIEEFISANEIAGFNKTDEGLYLKISNAGDEESVESKSGDLVRFTFQMYQLDNPNTIAENAVNNPAQTTLGNSSNLKFLNLGLLGVKKDMELEMLIPSHLGFESGPQVFPYQIRKDLFDRGYINQVARPNEPLRIKIKIVEIR